MHTYKSLLLVLLVALFSSFAVAQFTIGMSQVSINIEVARILLEGGCTPWKGSEHCHSVVDEIHSDAVDADIDIGAVIDALVAIGVPVSVASASASTLANQTLHVDTTPTTSTGAGGASAN